MKIAALTLDYPPRRWIGSEVATHAILRHLEHDVEVFTLGPASEPWEHDGIPVENGYRAFRQAAAHADLVITHVELGRRLRGLACPKVGITHNAREDTGRACGAYDWSLLIHNAEATARQLASVRRAPFTIVHPPVDWRDWHTTRGDAITLVNVTGEKGSDTFWELARRMPSRRFIGVIGGWGEPDLRDLPNVDIVQHTDDMRSVYAQTRILLMPSEHESWGRVAVEAMSSGIPVLATDLPGPREAIGVGGVLIELDWVDEYERQINRLDDTHTYDTISRAALNRARQLEPATELKRLSTCLEALTAGTQGPWRVDGLRIWRHRPSGRCRVEHESSMRSSRYERLPHIWEEVIDGRDHRDQPDRSALPARV